MNIGQLFLDGYQPNCHVHKEFPLLTTFNCFYNSSLCKTGFYQQSRYLQQGRFAASLVTTLLFVSDIVS